MAHAEQTPRDPGVEGLAAAMGVMFGLGEGFPLKPTFRNLHIKGGGWARRHLLHKALGRNGSQTEE